MSFITRSFSPKHLPTGISGSDLLDSFSAPTQFTTLLKGAQVIDLNSLQVDALQRQSEQWAEQSTSEQSMPSAAVPKMQRRQTLENNSATVSSRAIAAKRLTRTIASDRVMVRQG